MFHQSQTAFPDWFCAVHGDFACVHVVKQHEPNPCKRGGNFTCKCENTWGLFHKITLSVHLKEQTKVLYLVLALLRQLSHRSLILHSSTFLPTLLQMNWLFKPQASMTSIGASPAPRRFQDQKSLGTFIVLTIFTSYLWSHLSKQIYEALHAQGSRLLKDTSVMPHRLPSHIIALQQQLFSQGTHSQTSATESIKGTKKAILSRLSGNIGRRYFWKDLYL